SAANGRSRSTLTRAASIPRCSGTTTAPSTTPGRTATRAAGPASACSRSILKPESGSARRRSSGTALAAGAVPDDLRLAEPLSGFKIDREHADAGPAALVAVRPGVVDGAVVVPEQRGVDAALVDVDRLRPFAADVVRPDEEVAAVRHIRRNHVKPAVAPADRRRIDAARGAAVFERKLAVARQHVADLLPVQQIAAVPQRHAREKLERAVDQIIILADAADARVGIEARDDRVLISKHAKTSQKF